MDEFKALIIILLGLFIYFKYFFDFMPRFKY